MQLGGTLGVPILGTLYLSRSGPPGSAFAATFSAALFMAVLTAITVLSMLRSAPTAEPAR